MKCRHLLLLPVSLLTAVACHIEEDAPAARAIGNTRAVISAEYAYQSANSGYFGTITCLATPSACIPAYTGPSFLDSKLAAATVIDRKYTYKWFEVKSAAGAPPGSIDRYCYGSTAEGSGLLAIGGESDGVIGVSTNGSAHCCTAQATLDETTCPQYK
jgi:hypothetical protein